ncbi:MAG: nitroreductase family protein [Dehalococcoidia bacterium]|nr:nitroreductase family protein [Dehalococcoidia bacterium]
MELTEVLRNRRSIKNFDARPVPQEDLVKLIDVARYSPSGNNTNPWRFVVITDRKTLDRLAEAHPYCRWLGSAPAGIALLADPVLTRYWLEDCCIAAYSIWLAATELGLGVAWAAMHQSDNASESERRQTLVGEILSIPGGFRIPIVLGVGYPSVTPGEKKRPPVHDIVFWQRYAPRARLK